MARPPGGEGRFELSPRARRIAGWVAAIAVIAGIALAVRLLGGNADGAAVVPTPTAGSSGPAAGTPGTVTFGTALGPTRAVDPATTVDRFAAGDTFAYSVAPVASLPPTVYVEVDRTAGGDQATVQSIEEGEQAVLPGDAIGFSVPADDLLAVFGPGEYRMRIYVSPADDPIAEGSFLLVAEAGVSPPATPSGS